MGIPKVKISFDADFDELKKGVKGASDEVEGFGNKMGDYGKKVGAAFAVAGVAAAAYAGKLLIDGVKSAIEDEAAQAKLATTLKNVTGATSAQVAQVEAYILKTELATGKTDNELRPSFERLSRATGDINKAMALQQLAMDVSAGSGKDLASVTEAISKSYEGNNVALGKLGLGIDKASLKSMSFEDITKKLSTTFEGQASKQADTFQGKLARLSVAFDEAKETVGTFIIDAVTPLVSKFVNDIIPKIGEVAEKIIPALKTAFTIFVTFYKNILAPVFESFIGAFKTISEKITENKDKILPFINMLKTLYTFIADKIAPVIGTVLGGAFTVAGKLVGAAIDLIADGMKGIVLLVNGVITVVNLAIKAYNLLPGHKDIQELGKVGQNASAAVAGMTGSQGAVANTSAAAVTAAKDLIAPSLSTISNGITPAAAKKKTGTGSDTKYIYGNDLSGFEKDQIAANAAILAAQIKVSMAEKPNIALTVNGAIDPESTARQIVGLLNDSFYRGTGGAGGLVT
jgi:hypothetical protein